jgi:hypothetical protein
MEYTGNDFMSTMTTISKENEIKQELGLSGAAPAPTPTDPPTEAPGRNIEPLYLEGEDEPINLRTDLSAAAKPQR